MKNVRNVGNSDFDIRKLPYFENHKLVSYLNDDKSGLRGYIAMYNEIPGRPAFGATRILNYDNEIAALNDVLQLSKMMSHKCAMAGLKYAGAKGVIILPQNISNIERKVLLQSYANRVNIFAGNFITGADVGISRDDVMLMRRRSKYLVGVKTDPVRYTALGIYYSIKVSLKEIFGNDSIVGRSFAIQGLGKVGSSLLALLYKDTDKISIADISDSAVDKILQEYPKVKVVDYKSIHREKVDIFSPCALSHAINAKTSKELDCKAIVGGANNQLDSSETGNTVYKREILYAPDYVVNAGGLISVVDEYENGNSKVGRVEQRIDSIGITLRSIFIESSKKHTPTNIVSDERAQQFISKYENI